jgi:hypothetical protein
MGWRMGADELRLTETMVVFLRVVGAHRRDGVLEDLMF